MPGPFQWAGERRINKRQPLRWGTHCLLLFVYCCEAPHCVPTPHFVLPLTHRERLGSSHFGAIMNNATLDVHIQVLLESDGSLDDAGFFLPTTERQALPWKNLCEPCLRIMDRVIKIHLLLLRNQNYYRGCQKVSVLHEGYSHISLNKAGQDPNGASLAFPGMVYIDVRKTLFSLWGCCAEKM